MGCSSNKKAESVTLWYDRQSIEASTQYCFRIQKSSCCCILCHFSSNMYELGGTLCSNFNENSCIMYEYI